MVDEKKPSRAKKIINLVLNVVTYVFLAICIFALLLSITGKKDADGATDIFGIQMRVVISNSMEKCAETDVSDYPIGSLPIRTLIFIDRVPADALEAEVWYSNIQVGDVLTFRYVYITQETITHRVTGIEPKEGGYLIHLEGDNKASDANTLTQTIDTTQKNSPNYIIGKVTAKSYPLGLLISALKSPVGIICIIIIPALIIGIFELLRLINALGADKRAKERAEMQRREDELEEVKRQLELLQQQAMAARAAEAEEAVELEEAAEAAEAVEAEEAVEVEETEEAEEAERIDEPEQKEEV